MPGERRAIDLNADVGEASDDAGIAVERALLGLVTSAHVACGGHAGRRRRRCGRRCRRPWPAGCASAPIPPIPIVTVSAGGRWRFRPVRLTASLTGQIGALVEVAATLGTTVRSVKAHGALYGEVARGVGRLWRAARRRGRALRSRHRARAPLWRPGAGPGERARRRRAPGRVRRPRLHRGRRAGGAPAARFGLRRSGEGCCTGTGLGRARDGDRPGRNGALAARRHAVRARRHPECSGPGACGPRRARRRRGLPWHAPAGHP